MSTPGLSARQGAAPGRVAGEAGRLGGVEGAATFEFLVSLCLGVALAAACGLRVFLPLLLVGSAARLGYVTVSGGMEWLSSTPALLALAAATVLEISAYFVPWLDNALDAAGAPVAIAAGTILAAAVLGETSPLLRWTLATVAGGGAAAAVHGSLAVVRKLSSVATLGLANPLVAAGEAVAALLMVVIAIALPLLTVGGMVVALGLLLRRASTIGWRRRQAL